jgi:hypothetical protein
VSLPFPPSGGTAGVCNSYVPSDTTFNRFMYIVQFLAHNGFYLLLVHCLTKAVVWMPYTSARHQSSALQYQAVCNTPLISDCCPCAGQPGIMR